MTTLPLAGGEPWNSVVNSIECRPVAPNCKYLFNAMTRRSS